MKRRVINALLVIAIVVLVGFALVVGAPNSSGGDGEKFGGTDAAVTQTLEESGYHPWFQPLFSPDSGEVESGLFAVQAAIGAGLFGYCLGVLRGRRQARRAPSTGLTQQPGPHGSAASTTLAAQSNIAAVHKDPFGRTSRRDESGSSGGRA